MNRSTLAIAFLVITAFIFSCQQSAKKGVLAAAQPDLFHYDSSLSEELFSIADTPRIYLSLHDNKVSADINKRSIQLILSQLANNDSVLYHVLGISCQLKLSLHIKNATTEGFLAAIMNQLPDTIIGSVQRDSRKITFLFARYPAIIPGMRIRGVRPVTMEAAPITSQTLDKCSLFEQPETEVKYLREGPLTGSFNIAKDDITLDVCDVTLYHLLSEMFRQTDTITLSAYYVQLDNYITLHLQHSTLANFYDKLLDQLPDTIAASFDTSLSLHNFCFAPYRPSDAFGAQRGRIKTNVPTIVIDPCASFWMMP